MKKPPRPFDEYCAEVMSQDFKHDVAKVKSKVLHILLTHEPSRDNYNFLIAEYFRRFFPADKTVFATWYDWTTHPDAPCHNSIIRARSMLQKVYPEIRGKTYDKRMNKFETTKDNWYPKGTSWHPKAPS